MSDDITVIVASDVDVVGARQRGRELAGRVGFSPGDQTVIAAAISEIVRNIVTYARRGEVRLAIEHDGDRSAVVVVARDDGPGISDVPLAMRDGYASTYVKKVDPAKGPAENAVLKPRAPIPDPSQAVRGTIVDVHGMPDSPSA